MSAESFTADLRRVYDQQIRVVFGELRPLRLEGTGRFFAPPPALPLRAMFIAPALTTTQVAATEAEPMVGADTDLFTWLEQQRSLVVLGDPGSGKSTLVAWAAWRLCAGLTEPLPAWCDGALPVPMILRDMVLGDVRSFSDLLAAHAQTELIRSHPELGERWLRHLQRVLIERPGSLLFLIDGLDELSASARDGVREAIRDGISEIPEARFVITSRVVGYDECAIEAGPPLPPSALAMDGGEAGRPFVRALQTHIDATLRQVTRLYVCPFDAGRIRRFAHNWFDVAEADGGRGAMLREKFVEGLMRDAVALQLARTPNLLVMAAQVFGITNTLPDGRANLYAAITKAYLESIDQLYGLADSRYSLPQKTSWLAKVGYEMQSRRDMASAERELLVPEAEVRAWLDEAMRDSGLTPDEAYVHQFVNAIARRSGLFIPRAEGQYAFSHLSIQEYFAALHLQMTLRDAAVADPEAAQRVYDELGRLGGLISWREALVTFFELPDWSPKVVARLLDAVFGRELADVPKVVEDDSQPGSRKATKVELLARLAVHPGIATSQHWRDRAFDRAWGYLGDERKQEGWKPVSDVLASLTVNQTGSDRVWQALRHAPQHLGGTPKLLHLRRARFTNYEPLAEFKETSRLWLEGSSITDLRPLVDLLNLVELDLDETQLRDLEPLNALPTLQTLWLRGASAPDWRPLGSLAALRFLSISAAQTRALPFLKPNQPLRALSVGGPGAVELDGLPALRSLRRLTLWRVHEPNLRALGALSGLEELTLMGGDGLREIEHLRALDSLRYLNLGVSDLADIEPLAALCKLQQLEIPHTNVTDLSPLVGLKELKLLNIAGTPVRNIEVLKQKDLKIIGTPKPIESAPR